MYKIQSNLIIQNTGDYKSDKKFYNFLNTIHIPVLEKRKLQKHKWS